MASGQSTAIAGGKKIRTGRQPLSQSPSRESTRKLTMKYIELDGNDSVTMATSPDAYVNGDLYQVSKTRNGNEPFKFTRVRKVIADFELTPEQNRILKDMLGFTGVTAEQYFRHAVLSKLQADIDDFYKGDDPRRERAMAAADKWTVNQ